MISALKQEILDISRLRTEDRPKSIFEKNKKSLGSDAEGEAFRVTS